MDVTTQATVDKLPIIAARKKDPDALPPHRRTQEAAPVPKPRSRPELTATPLRPGLRAPGPTAYVIAAVLVVAFVAAVLGILLWRDAEAIEPEQKRPAPTRSK